MLSLNQATGKGWSIFKETFKLIVFFRFTENSCGCSSSCQALLHANIQDADASWILLLCGSLEERLNKTGWQNHHQSCRAVGPFRVREPGEVDKRKGIPHPPHATMKPLIFKGRYHIA